MRVASSKFQVPTCVMVYSRPAQENGSHLLTADGAMDRNGVRFEFFMVGVPWVDRAGAGPTLTLDFGLAASDDEDDRS